MRKSGLPPLRFELLRFLDLVEVKLILLAAELHAEGTTLAGSMPDRNPSARALMINFVALAVTDFPPKPVRTAALRVSLNDCRERCMASRKIRSTSFSNVTVVLNPESLC